MAIRRDQIDKDQVGAERMTPAFRRGRWCHEEFMEEPHVYTATDDNGAPTGTTGNVNICDTGQFRFEYVILGAGQTIVRPVLATDGGYDWGMDQTATEGTEINFASLKQSHPRMFKVGTDAGFYSRLRCSLEDASGYDLTFGFRANQAYQTAFASYTDFAAIRVLGESSLSSGEAPVTTITRLNSGAVTTTTTPAALRVADGQDFELEVRVLGRRAAFFLNGAGIGQVNFDYDLTDYLIPVAFLLHTTDIGGQFKTLGFECGDVKGRPAGTLAAAASAGLI
jgi:hypothetical protein